jgi:hypothetical protein
VDDREAAVLLAEHIYEHDCPNFGWAMETGMRAQKYRDKQRYGLFGMLEAQANYHRELVPGFPWQDDAMLTQRRG